MYIWLQIRRIYLCSLFYSFTFSFGLKFSKHKVMETGVGRGAGRWSSGTQCKPPQGWPLVSAGLSWRLQGPPKCHQVPCWYPVYMLGRVSLHFIVKGKKVVCEVRRTWILILAPPLPGCVTWGRLLNNSDPQFPHKWKERSCLPCRFVVMFLVPPPRQLNRSFIQ